MKVDLTTKPQVTIDVSPVLEAYLRWVFKTPTDQKEIIINRNQDIGKHISSHILISDTPIKPKSLYEHPVTIILPTNKKNHYSIKYHFLYLSGWGMQKINDFIETEFKQWVNEKYKRGYQWGWKQHEITDAIVRGLSLRNNAINYDTIKKIDYRHRSQTENERFKNLLSA